MVYAQAAPRQTARVTDCSTACRGNYASVSGVCSVVGVTDEGRVVESATIGNEGMTGIPVILGFDLNPSMGISQVSGNALRIPATPFLEATERWTAFTGYCGVTSPGILNPRGMVVCPRRRRRFPF